MLLILMTLFHCGRKEMKIVTIHVFWLVCVLFHDSEIVMCMAPNGRIIIKPLIDKIQNEAVVV